MRIRAFPMTMDEKYVENIWNLLKAAIQVNNSYCTTQSFSTGSRTERSAELRIRNDLMRVRIRIQYLIADPDPGFYFELNF